MSSNSSVFDHLPYSLREQVRGYQEYVEASMLDIAVHTGIAVDDRLRDHFLFVAAIRRLWGIVTGRYWLLDHSLELVERSAEGIEAGAARLRRGEGEMRVMATLSRSLESELHRLGLLELVKLRSLGDVLAALKERDH